MNADAAALARRSADALWAGDHASRGLGMQLVQVGPGCARVEVVTKAMANGHGNCHGGFIFAVADSAFAFACNAYGILPLGAILRGVGGNPAATERAGWPLCRFPADARTWPGFGGRRCS